MKKTILKQSLHPRNRYQGSYDLERLSAINPHLSDWLITTPDGRRSVNFSEPKAVRALNQALLKQYYDLNWQLSDGFLCPPVPGRADYLHYIADLLSEDIQGPVQGAADVLDIGCGANCIYPLIGYAEYGWRFTGTDIHPASVTAANAIVAANPGLQQAIRIRLQKNPAAIFNGILRKTDFYHLTICNPPFHSSAEDAQQGSARKIRNLGIDKHSPLNFAGQHNELWCSGGERGFITRMIHESVIFAGQAGWFTSLVSKKENLLPLTSLLRSCGAAQIRILEMGQGQKQSRILAWSFHQEDQRRKLLRRR